MERRSVEAIARVLNQAHSRYLVAGGLAVAAHGLVRFTAAVDLVLDPEPAALLRAVEALASLGYRPRAPVEFAEFADPSKRASWARDKGLTGFSTFSPQHPATEVDLFIEPPFDFERADARASQLDVGPGVAATFVALDDLMEMKRRAGRPQDLQDIAGLESLADSREPSDE